MMKSHRLTILVLAALVVCFTPKTMAVLDNSEIFALQDFYNAHSSALLRLFPPWSSDPSGLCQGGSVWQGLTCTDGHISAISLSSIPLGGTIPTSFSGLNNLTTLALANTGLTGTLPTFLGEMKNLQNLDLRGNSLSLCQSTPFVLPGTWYVNAITLHPIMGLLGSRDEDQLTGQTLTICVDNSCCGCQALWVNSFGCNTNIPPCASCNGSFVPPEFPNATCSNGYIVVPGPYTGGLTVNGKLAITGDFTLPITQALTFVGFTSTLNVTGRFTMKSNGIIVAATDTDISTLQYLGSYNYFRVSYMYVSNPATNLGAFTGGNSLVAVHPRRSCKKPYSSSVGNANQWTISVRYYNGCNTWWIILVCVLPAVLIGGLAGAIPAMCK